MFHLKTPKELLFEERLRSQQAELELEQAAAELGVEVSGREINEIMQGLQISDLEIQLLELQLGGEQK